MASGQARIFVARPTTRAVTGIRQAVWANAHRIPVEELKAPEERGTYLHPELYGAPEEKGIEWARNPEVMKRQKAERERFRQGPAATPDSKR